VTIIYVITNIAYFAVLPVNDIQSSLAVAVTFGDKMLGWFAWVMPLFVACSTFGSLNGAIFASSRLFFVGARNGHLPGAISLINVKCLTPIPSIIFMVSCCSALASELILKSCFSLQCLITILLVFIPDVYALINYVSFVEALFILLSITGLLYLRRTQPDAKRPIKVNLILPIIFFITCSFLVISSCYVCPVEVGVGCVIIISGELLVPTN